MSPSRLVADLTGYHIRTHIVDIHSQLKWPLCQDSINLHKCVLVSKCLYAYGEVPQYLQGIFQRVDSVHNHGTHRAEAGLFVPRANSTAAKNMFAYEGAVLYNGLPMVLKSADNFIDFKRNCDTKLFSCDTNYSRLEHTTCDINYSSLEHFLKDTTRRKELPELIL